jgi:OHCU decarboxylase
MNDRLQKLNDANLEAARSMFRNCCGSERWASLMAESLPFISEEEVLQRASQICRELGEDDWLEAFMSHPKIGESKAAANQQKLSAEWSKGEQSGIAEAADRTREELAEANRLYAQKFGFIFIVCASGKSAEELLELCQSRLGNSRETEISIAAEEQQKITEIRLEKLLHQ